MRLCQPEQDLSRVDPYPGQVLSDAVSGVQRDLQSVR
jgi:hypothetical protein